MDQPFEDLPAELDNLVRSELREHEKLVWAGQPVPGRFARSAIPLVLFGVPFTGFAIFWIATASAMLFGAAGEGGPGGFFACFPLFGIPFLLVGLGMLTSPYWMYRRALKTCYVLTDRRAILWTAGWFGATEVRSYQPAQLGKMTRREHADGSGNLVFEEIMSLTQDSDGHSRTQRTERGFLGVDKVRDVEELVRRTLLDRDERPPI